MSELSKEFEKIEEEYKDSHKKYYEAEVERLKAIEPEEECFIKVIIKKIIKAFSCFK